VVKKEVKMTDQIPSTPTPAESQTPPALPKSSTPGGSTHQRRPSGLVWGAVLIFIGLFALLEQIFHLDFGLFFLPLLAAIFLLAGILGRRSGLIIPGGILAGIGVGALLIDGPFSYLSDQGHGGLFMLTFAGGWLLITLASLLTDRVMLWPLIPGAFMGLFGIALLGEQAGLLNLFTLGWPIILIAIGLYLVLRRRELTK
jgi:hypothetical protein